MRVRGSVGEVRVMGWGIHYAYERQKYKDVFVCVFLTSGRVGCPNLGADCLPVLIGNYLLSTIWLFWEFSVFPPSCFHARTEVAFNHSAHGGYGDCDLWGHMIAVSIRNPHQSVSVGSQEAKWAVWCQQEKRFVSFGVKNKIFFHNKLSRLQTCFQQHRKSFPAFF